MPVGQFANWPLPDSVTPWEYNPENWQPMPTHPQEFVDALTWLLAQQLGQAGGAGLDVGSTAGGSTVEGEEDDTFETEAVPAISAHLEAMVKDYKVTKKPSPTDDGSTTVGTGTTIGTASSSGTTATQSTTQSGSAGLR